MQHDRINNLGILLQHFVGLELAVECKNGKVFRGMLNETDDYMNLVIQITAKGLTVQDEDSDCSWSTTSCPQINFQVVHIRGSNIRYIHFPDNADLPKLVRLGLDRIKSAKDKYARGTRKRRSVN